MYSRYICVALAALAVVACATDIPPAMENEVDLAGAWAEARAEVLVQQKAGKSDSACQKVADDAMEEVTDSCSAAQKLVDGLPRGQHCCKKGVSLVTKARQNLDNARKASNDCQAKLTKLQNVRVTFNNVKYRDLRDGQCHRSFFSGSSYRNAKNNVYKQVKECNRRKGAISAFTKAVEDAKRARDRMRKSCRTSTQNNMNSMFNKANRLCNSGKNRKAWTRAQHMICVLKKSTLQNCKVPSLPKITKASLDFSMCKGGEEQFVTLSRAYVDVHNHRKGHISHVGWFGNWDGVADGRCPGDTVMIGQGSIHSNSREDRRWRQLCANFGSRQKPKLKNASFWAVLPSGQETPFRQHWKYGTICGNQGILYGVYSQHHNHGEDRRFKFYCRAYQNIELYQKSWAGWCNWYDRECNYQCPTDKVMIGVHSEFSGGHRDRRFRYQCAKMKVFTSGKDRLA
jgi:hypothetical protein